MTSAKISPEKCREYARTYRAKHPEKYQSAEYRAYKARLEHQRRQTPEYKEYIKLWRQKQRQKKRDRYTKSSLLSEDGQFRRRRLLYGILALERFWTGEHFEFPFGIGNNYGQPPEDLSVLINGRQSMFVKRFLDEPFTGAGIYSELVEQLLWKGAEEGMEFQRTKKILAARIAKERQLQRSSVEEWLRRQKEHLDARLAQLEKEKQSFYDSLGPNARKAFYE